jgi:altronate hydrolase
MLEVQGFLRNDGRFGIRNHLLVLYTVECARTIAQRIAGNLNARVLGFPGCYGNSAAYRTLIRIGTHQNTGAVLVVALGCEHTDYRELHGRISDAGIPAELLVIQESGGSEDSVKRGVEAGERLRQHIDRQNPERLQREDLVVGLECGGSDASSGLIANPAVGVAVDRLVSGGGTAVAEELTEMLGAEDTLAARAGDSRTGERIRAGIEKARRYSRIRRNFSISPGNITGGLTTIEEKSLGAILKLGNSPIVDLIGPDEVVNGKAGLFVLDRIPDPQKPLVCMCGGGDATGLTDLAACGAHLLIFTTGRGTPVGHPIAPVVKVCGNPETCSRMGDNIDVRLDGYFRGHLDLTEAGAMVFDRIQRVAQGQSTRAEDLGHNEYWIEYKY